MVSTLGSQQHLPDVLPRLDERVRLARLLELEAAVDDGLQSPADVMAEAASKMDTAMAGFTFTDDKIKSAAARFVERYRNSKARSLGHNVGLEVHDVPSMTETLEPGQIFTVEPAMQIPELHLGIRLEDMLLITDTGYENLSAFVPIEIADIEKTMTRHGLSDAALKLK